MCHTAGLASSRGRPGRSSCSAPLTLLTILPPQQGQGMKNNADLEAIPLLSPGSCVHTMQLDKNREVTAGQV